MRWRLPESTGLRTLGALICPWQACKLGCRQARFGRTSSASSFLLMFHSCSLPLQGPALHHCHSARLTAALSIYCINTPKYIWITFLQRDWPCAQCNTFCISCGWRKERHIPETLQLQRTGQEDAQGAAAHHNIVRGGPRQRCGHVAHKLRCRSRHLQSHIDPSLRIPLLQPSAHHEDRQKPFITSRRELSKWARPSASSPRVYTLRHADVTQRTGLGRMQSFNKGL